MLAFDVNVHGRDVGVLHDFELDLALANSWEGELDVFEKNLKGEFSLGHERLIDLSAHYAVGRVGSL